MLGAYMHEGYFVNVYYKSDGFISRDTVCFPVNV